MSKKKKLERIEYAGKKFYVQSETLNFIFVSEKKNGDKQFGIPKKDLDAYKAG